MATLVVRLTLFLKIALLGQETSISHAIGIAVATAVLILVSVSASRKLQENHPAFNVLALAKYAGKVDEITLFRRLRYTFNGPSTIQIAYDNVSRLKLDCFACKQLKLREV